MIASEVELISEGKKKKSLRATQTKYIKQTQKKCFAMIFKVCKLCGRKKYLGDFKIGYNSKYLGDTHWKSRKTHPGTKRQHWSK